MAIPIKYTLQGDAGATNPVNVRVDKSTDTLQVISYPHHEIHSGSHFYVYRTGTLGNGDVMTVGITNADTGKEMHMFMGFDVAAACTVDLLEDVTSFAGGVSFTILNNHRNLQGIKNSGATCLTGATGDDLITPTGGSEIYSQVLGAGNRSGGTMAHDAEIIMKRGSKYLYRITNGATAQGVSIILNWYEHTERNQ